MLKIIVLALLVLSTKSYSQSCLTIAQNTYQDSRTLWSYVAMESPSHQKNTIYSFMDIAMVYHDVMKRIPNRPERTVGVYVEVKDRFNYMVRWIRTYRWINQFYVDQVLQVLGRDMAYMQRCYRINAERIPIEFHEFIEE